ncbi:MAG: hypothetical protein LCH52_14965 [Bacteroidetes bacterium]|nr:hypothetical protein [Bacteroidota bacterium]
MLDKYYLEEIKAELESLEIVITGMENILLDYRTPAPVETFISLLIIN